MLDERVQVGGQLVGEVVDRDLAAGVDVAVQGVAVVDEDLGNLYVDSGASSSGGWRTSSPTVRPGR